MTEKKTPNEHTHRHLHTHSHVLAYSTHQAKQQDKITMLQLIKRSNAPPRVQDKQIVFIA